MESIKSKILVDEFLQKAKGLKADVEPIRVLRARAYQIANANVLIRASIQSAQKKYFFGLNYITAEEVANLENPFFAFICDSVEQTLIIPASILIQQLPLISHDRNGEFKINIDRSLNIVLSGHNNRLDCSIYRNAWGLLLDSRTSVTKTNTIEQSLHSVYQGRLLEIGRIRGYQTYTPNKSKRFNNTPLGEIATLKACPDLQFSEYDLLRQIDVLWFQEKGKHLLPQYAFEVELTTGTWAGMGRMATLLPYSDVRLYVISEDSKRFQQVIFSYDDYFRDRYKHVSLTDVGELYAAERNLRELREKVDL